MLKKAQFMMRHFFVALFALSIIAPSMLSATALAQVPPARALFLDLETVFTQSKVGKNIRAQLQEMLAEISIREKTSADSFAAREQAFLESARERDPVALHQDWENLQAEKEGSGNLFQLERTAVQSASNTARRSVNATLNEIMQSILVERGANMVVSVNAVHVGGVDYDITAEVIARLDKQLPELKVERPR